MGNLGIGLVLAFVYGWAIALTILAFVPFMIIGGVLQTKMLTGFSSKDKEVLEDAGKVMKILIRTYLKANLIKKLRLV